MVDHKHPFYQMSPEEIIRQFDTGVNGLSEEKATELQASFGQNLIPEKKPYSISDLVVEQLTDAMVLILMAAALLAGFMGEWMDTIIILLIVTINSVLGVVQAYNAEKAIDAIRQMAALHATVLRSGATRTVDSSMLVPGDCVLLEQGNLIPADLRIIESYALMADESALTGESMPAQKQSEALSPASLPLADQTNMAYKGTVVVKGRAKGIVVQTGVQTEIGKIASLLDRKKTKTPLQQRMEDFSRKLSVVILGVCLVFFTVGWMRGENPLQMLLIAVSLAVAAIPEALPALVTIALARGASRLAKNKALIRKLPAVETLGSVNTICTDKTGTLTQNQMTVQEHFLTDPTILPFFYEALALNNDAGFQNGVCSGDPTETALLEFLLKYEQPGFISHIRTSKPRLAEIGFTAERKRMTTFHTQKAQTILISKGAVEKICERVVDGIDTEILVKKSHEWASQGLRVLAFGYRILSQPESRTILSTLQSDKLEALEYDLHILGLVGMSDPPREEAEDAIRQCNSAGIRVVMITGDHPGTALTIAKRIGMPFHGTRPVLTGTELQSFEFSDLQKAVCDTTVYARVSPSQKLDIVTAMQSQGQFVAMTGDGVNDAPALKASNIGIAMGISGSDVSKEAADMILMDDNFATIVKAVREGRRIFDNIRKFVRYIMTCNSAEILTLFFAPLLSLPLPLLPVHILWINLITDGLPGVALAGEKAEPDIMDRPPRPAKESLFAHGTAWHIVWVGSLMASITILVQTWALSQDLAHWQTMVFTVLSLSQLGHVMAIRSEHVFIFKKGLFSNKPLILSVLFTLLLQLFVIYNPVANAWLKTQPLSILELSVCLLGAAIVFHAVEFEKWVNQRRKKKKLSER
ncbi:MAG: cation-translocating P-type ATPase [Saprospiraceae bacterium]|nr:cation-translocating P-type ATPase [Saprospiraceae bacterium]